MNIENYNIEYQKYIQLINKNPSDYDLRISIGILSTKLQKTDEAIVHFKKAIVINKKSLSI